MTSPRRLLLAVALGAAACRTAPPPVPPTELVPGLSGATKVFTLTNLHPDESRSRLYAANFQQDGLIPVCSEVTLLSLDGDELTFAVQKTGKTYEYFNHDAGGAPLAENVALYFGRACPESELASLTEHEREAVRLGVANVGMRKRAVILAIGYPPHRSTPDLDAPRWLYWHSHFNSFAVIFDKDGRVTSLKE